MPALAEPQLRAAVAAVVDERKVLAVGDEASCKLKRVNEGVVNGTFVVEVEQRRVATDSNDTACVIGPPHRGNRSGILRLGSLVGIGRVERVARQQMLDVREEQLLVLLLVMKADLDAAEELPIEVGTEQIEDGRVYAFTVLGDLVVTRPRQKPA
jgi:hypothetical protein